MCLGTVCRTTALLDGDAVLVQAGDRELRASLLTVEDPVRVGDWLLVHAGFALARLTETQAREALAIREPAGEDGP
jgi:hydrogenase expression/formation protein HypC